jgi:beta-fructofuranosidase
MGDTWQFSDGDKVHAFFLQWRDFDDINDAESGSIGHLVSKNMLDWEELPHALLKGESGSFDELDLWTGSCIKRDGKYYLFYTSRNTVNSNANAISLATSDDGVNFVKYEGNPVITPDKRYYCSNGSSTPLAVHSNLDSALVDCRDLQVIYDEKSGCYYGYVAMRRPANECTQTSVIALAKSYDLMNWEQLPPVYVPDKYHCVETPDVFEMDGKWYMICLTGNHYGQRNPTGDPNMTGCLTVYAVSDSPEGPFVDPEGDNVLLGSSQLSGICAKSVLHKGKRYLFYTQSNLSPNNDVRTLAYPKEIVTDGKGGLALKWFDGVSELYTSAEKPFTSENAIVNYGRWGSIVPVDFENGSVTLSPVSDWSLQAFNVNAGNFVLKTTVKTDGARGAGIVYGIDGETVYCSNRLALLDFEGNEVLFTKLRNFPRLNGRRVIFDKNEYELTLLVIDTAIEIYLDGKLVLHHQEDRLSGKIGFLAERGRVTFENPVLYRIGD